MEHNQNIDQLRRAFGLTAKEAALVGAMLGGVCDGALLAASCRVASPGALRKQMTRIRVKLPRGGVSSLRRPARYWLSAGAVEICRLALGGGGESAGFEHEPHEPHEGVRGAAKPVPAPRALGEGTAPKAHSWFLSDAEGRPPLIRVVRVVRVQKSLAAHDAAAASQDMPR
jgi:hypothetical protein